jgi:transposase
VWGPSVDPALFNARNQRLYASDSRMMLVRAYPRETQEMVFDAHERAFAFFRGACSRGIYDVACEERSGANLNGPC